MKLEVQKETKNYNVKESLIINAKGVTLIALVITIIILLILSGVAIATLTGENGLFARAKQAKENYSISSAKEKLQLAISDLMVEQTSKGENLTKEDLPKINNNEIDVKSTETFPVEVICENYIFNVDENFTVTYVREASGTVVTFTTEPESYTNKDEIKILVKISNPKGIKSIQKPGETDRILAQGQKEVGIDYKVTKNGHYIFTIVDEEGKETVKDIYIDLIDKLKPIDFIPEVQLKNDNNIIIIANAQDSERTEESTKSGINYCEYYIKKDTEKGYVKYNTNEIKNLEIGKYQIFVVAYDRAGNSKQSTTVDVKISVKYKSISAGGGHCLAIDNQGNIWSWGKNNYGQLGDGTGDNRKKLVKIEAETKFKQISAGNDYSLAIDSEGNIWSWGDNGYGQLGDGTTKTQKNPVKIKNDIKFEEISAGREHSLAIDSEGNIWSWGYNACGQLGDGTIHNTKEPIQITYSNKFTKVVTGYNYSLAIDKDGYLWGWGRNREEMLEVGTKEDILIPKKIMKETQFSQISADINYPWFYNLTIDNKGNIWSWGHNNYGQLGNGTTENKMIPNEIVINESYFVKTSIGTYSSFAIDRDGKIWSWGNNNCEQLGDGTTKDKLKPSKINSEGCFLDISAGKEINASFCLAIDSEGNIWSWGRNNYGQLGFETVVYDVSTPTKINF